MAGDIRQISVFKNNKSVVELMNKLHITTPGKGCRLHNEGDRNSNNSLIGINLVDYSVDPSVFVSDNITPSQLRELYYEAVLKRNDYKFNTSKIFGEPDKDGYCTTRIMRINRQRSYVQNGKTIEKNYPTSIPAGLRSKKERIYGKKRHQQSYQTVTFLRFLIKRSVLWRPGKLHMRPSLLRLL